MRMTVRYVYVLPIENQNSNSCRDPFQTWLLGRMVMTSLVRLTPTEPLLSNKLLSVKPLII